MFEKKSKSTDLNNDDLGVFRPAKGTRKVIIGDGVKFKGEITDADEVQVDGSADLILETDNLVVGSTGNLKGTIKTAAFKSGFILSRNLMPGIFVDRSWPASSGFNPAQVPF